MDRSCIQLVVAALLVGGGVVRADPIDARFQDLERRHGGRFATTTYGVSREGRPLRVLTLGAELLVGGAPRQPALLIVAGLDGRELGAVDVAFGVAKRLLDRHADLLERNPVHVVPCANPDAYQRFASGGGPADFGGALRPDDRDRDARIDEDPPADVNGDGVITWMRVPDPPAWIPRTHVVDDDEPRLSRPADVSKGEAATFALLPEGRDQDGDGRYAEDGLDGVSLDRNFPHQWPEHGDHAGPFPLSEPETRALVEWMLGREDVAAVLVLGDGDNLLNPPGDGGNDETGRAPKGHESNDHAVHAEIAKLYRELTDRKEARAARNEGSLQRFAYAQYGTPTFACDLYAPPKPERKATAETDGPDGKDGKDGPDGKDGKDGKDEKGENTVGADEDRGGAAGRSGRPRGVGAMGGGRAGRSGATERAAAPHASGGPDLDLDTQKRWLAVADRLGAGFAAWTPFEHPTLGRVEVGGFVPGFTRSIPVDAIDGVVETHAKLAAAVLERMPRVHVRTPSAERLGERLFRVRLQIENQGRLPTISEIGARVRRLTPFVASIDVAEDRLAAGARQSRTWSIPGGGEISFEWIVIGRPGHEVTCVLRSSFTGERRLVVKLPEDAR